jgi:hypothetical protein
MDDVVSSVCVKAIDHLQFSIAVAASEHVKGTLLMRPRIRPPRKSHDMLRFGRSYTVGGNLGKVKSIPAEVSDCHRDNIYIKSSAVNSRWRAGCGSLQTQPTPCERKVREEPGK